MPLSWLYGRLCDEGLASSLLDAMQQPIGLAIRILEERAYARAKEEVEAAKKPSDVKSTPMVRLVKEFRDGNWLERMQELERYQA